MVDVTGYLISKVSSHLEVDPEDIEFDANFMEMGVTSTQIVAIASEIEEEFSIKINPMIFFEYPQLNLLAEQLLKLITDRPVAIEAKASSTGLVGIPVSDDFIDMTLDNLSAVKLEQLGQLIKKHGDFVAFSAAKGRAPALLINDPESIGHILLKNSKNYVKGPGKEEAGLLMGKGITLTEGKEWQENRVKIQPFFTQDKSFFTELIEEINALHLNRWKAASRRGDEIDVAQSMSDLILDVTLSFVLGKYYFTFLDSNNSNPFLYISKISSRDVNFAERWRGNKKVFTKIVNMHRNGEIVVGGLLGHLITTDFTLDQIVDELNTFIIAAHETTSSALTFCWYELSKNPKLLQELKSEADGKLLNSFISETLRLYPPFWLITRTSIADDMVGGKPVPAGTNIFISPFLVHRSENLWPEAKSFDAGRFLNSPTGSRNTTKYLPFGLGPRSCMGAQLSLMEMGLHLSSFVRNIEELIPAPAEFNLVPALNLHLSGPLLLKIKLAGEPYA